MSAIRNFIKEGRKIVAIGRNYSEHAKELGNAVPTSPFFFLKPTTSYVTTGQNVEIPAGVNLHHEVELGIVIGKEGRDVEPSDASKFIGGYALGIDMTARNLQEQVKKKGLPWSAAKGFDTFTPISDFIDAKAIEDFQNVDLWLKVNDVTKQQGNTKDMIFPIPDLISYVSTIMKLEAGDLLLTGTPHGVGPCKEGDRVTAGLKYNGKELARLDMPIVARRGLFQYRE